MNKLGGRSLRERRPLALTSLFVPPPQVHVEGGGLGKPSPTPWAQIWPLPSVDPEVNEETCRVEEGLGASRAREGPVAAVTQEVEAQGA